MKRVVILTSNGIRHNYFKTMFSNADSIEVVKTYAEDDNNYFELKRSKNHDYSNLISTHFGARDNTEYDFFSDVIECCPDNSNTQIIKRGEINNPEMVQEIIELNPDLIISYGCSIIKPPLIHAFPERMINVHLGISPYYFGSGTNFHALVNGDFQCFGYTFMFIDEGIDTGEIIHQSRGEVEPYDNPHQIGNRLIKNMTKDFIKLIQKFDSVVRKKPVSEVVGKTYKRKDATDERTELLYETFKKGAVFNYLKNQGPIDRDYPIIEQEIFRDIN
jgi:phosphoribosylglycinamide formyltransferase 1